MDKKAELNIPEDKLKIALVTTIVLFAFVFILVILAIIFSPGEIQKFISNPLGGGNEGASTSGALKAEIGNVSLACTDSDGGIEPGIEAVVINASGYMFEDNCTTRETLKEYYCKNGQVNFTSITCANSCISGACSDYNWTCTDSDAGITLNKSGNIAGVQIELNRLSFAMDSCITNPTNATKVNSGGFINEYFCSGKYINSSVYGCSSGCLNGICNGTASLLNCNTCLAQNKNYSCFSGSSVSCSLNFDASKCFDCRDNKCGNGICNYEESFLTCNKDCSLLSCGNGRCDNPFENEGNCPIDCKWHCGNGVCDDGETLNSCAVDCGVNKTGCGNGVCEPPVETLTNCAKDCNNLCSGGNGGVSGSGGTVGGSGIGGTSGGVGVAGGTGTETETIAAPANSCTVLGQKRCWAIEQGSYKKITGPNLNQPQFEVCMNYTGNLNFPNKNGLFWGGYYKANNCGYGLCTGEGDCVIRPMSYFCGADSSLKLITECGGIVVNKDAVCSGALIGSTTLSNYNDCSSYCGNIGGAECYLQSSSGSPNCKCYTGLNINSKCNGVQVAFTNNVASSDACSKYCTDSRASCSSYGATSGIGNVNCVCYSGSSALSNWAGGRCSRGGCVAPCPSGSYHNDYYGEPTCEPYPIITGGITGNAIAGGITGNAIANSFGNSITGNVVSSSADYCGDGRCSTDTCESIYNCPVDCRGSICGNGICEFGETNSICSKDCKIPTCGNSVCDYGLESVNTCPQDCIIFCGNGICESGSGENSQNCQVDCLGGICNNDDDCFTGMSCVNHACVQSICTVDANCHSGKKCINGVCLSECTSNSQCGAGKQCKEGFCNLIGTLTVSQPNGGETLIRGQTYDIKWSVSTGVNRISLYLVSASGTQTTLVSGTSASTGKYSWQIPSGSSAGQYKIKMVNSVDANGQDSSNDWFSISAPASALPKLNSITPSNGKPGDLVTIFGEGFDSSSNRVIFKVVNSPFSFYNSKTGIEYLIGNPISSTDGRTLQFSIPSTLNQLDSSTESSNSISLVPGNYQIIVSNSSSGGVRSNPLSFLVNDYLNWPTKIQITSPKTGDIWSVGEQKTITWNPLSGEGFSLPKVSLYMHSKRYRSSTDDLRSIEYIKKINLSVSQTRGSLEWNIADFGDGDYYLSSPYQSIEQLDNLPWIPLDGKLDAYVQIYGTEANKNIVYKDDSDNFTLDTNVQGSCNECPRSGYLTCEGTSSKKTCGGECLKWSTTPCPTGQSCSNGVCGGTTITTICTAGQKRCSGTSGYQTCSVSNGVGSWGTTTSCPTGQTCSGSGVCGVAAGGACSKYPGAWYQVSPPGSIGCEAFCASKGLQSAGDFVGNVVLQKYTIYSNGVPYSQEDEGGLIGDSTVCHTSDWSASGGGYGGIQDAKSISPEFNLLMYSDAEKKYNVGYLFGGMPGYGENLFEYAGIQGCAGSLIQAAVDKCYCRDTSKDVNCPSGLYCNGEASGTCVKSICGNGVCEDGETADNCEIGPVGCYNPSMYYGDTSCILNKGVTCTATMHKGNCGVDCGSISSCSTSTYSLTRCTCYNGRLSCVY